MKELTLAQIAEACGGTLIGGNEAKEYTVTSTVPHLSEHL